MGALGLVPPPVPNKLLSFSKQRYLLVPQGIANALRMFMFLGELKDPGFWDITIEMDAHSAALTTEFQLQVDLQQTDDPDDPVWPDVGENSSGNILGSYIAEGVSGARMNQFEVIYPGVLVIDVQPGEPSSLLVRLNRFTAADSFVDLVVTAAKEQD